MFKSHLLPASEQAGQGALPVADKQLHSLSSGRTVHPHQSVDVSARIAV